eukprot:RCo018235
MSCPTHVTSCSAASASSLECQEAGVPQKAPCLSSAGSESVIPSAAIAALPAATTHPLERQDGSPLPDESPTPNGNGCCSTVVASEIRPLCSPASNEMPPALMSEPSCSSSNSTTEAVQKDAHQQGAEDEPVLERDRRALRPEFRVLRQTEEMVVLDKPCDVRMDGEFEFTVERYMHKSFGELLLQRPHPRTGEKRKLRFCHQLDHATSGVLVLGLTRKLTAAVGQCFMDRTARKSYLALVHGWPPIGAQAPVVLEWPIAEQSPGSFLMCVGTEGNPGRSALTEATVLAQGYYHGAPVAKVLLNPKSGRRHQLRVHCLHWGHPIVGDYTYSKDCPHIPRMMLHAWKLFLPIPLSEGDPPSGTLLETGDPFADILQSSPPSSDRPFPCECGGRPLRDQETLCGGNSI